jgi:1,2-diacylglycerol 3-beta-galactosyltransferase
MDGLTRIDLIYFDAGGGHRASATALKMVIDQQQRPWDTRLVNLQELLEPLDLFHKLFGLRLQDVYNLLQKRGWTLGLPQLCRLMQALFAAYHSKQVAVLEKYWRLSRPELVVSLVPHFNRALLQSLRRVCPVSPFVTVLTDLADYPPHFWIERQEQFLVCGSSRAVEQAKALGHTDDRIFRTSGMILHPHFYEPVTVDRRAERLRLGLEPDRATALVLFGGEGSGSMLDITRRLDRSGLPVQLILICGHNQKLKRQLREYASSIPMFVEGFTTEMPYYMQLADFLIGKPGPGSISEALAMKLPVVVGCNAWTAPQERYNADWVLQMQAGFVVRSYREIVPVVARLIEPATLARYRANAAAIQNKAVFEIPEILDRILKS